MTIDRNLIGIGAAILAALLIVYMPVSAHRVNQTVVSLVIVVLIFVAAFSLFEPELATVVAIGVSIVVVALRTLMRWVRSFLWRNLFRYTRRDFWQRRIGQVLIGSRRRRRRDHYDL